ncbi:MAG TPA: FAD-binding oxidoreductase [Bryobacteraceae bacterium]|nr:FAD-binding oxidoreductase [Bryobacteraceae bacterium]
MGPKHLRGVVTERRDITDELWIVRVRPDERIAFLPGQYVTIGLAAEDRLIERPYSVASSPDDCELEFFLEVVRGGKLSPHLYEVPPGGEVYIRPLAKGRFSLERQPGRPNHFLVATVTGVAPFVSMVRWLARQEAVGGAEPLRIAILQAASGAAEFGYREELAGYAQALGWLEYVPTISRPWLDQGWQGERGRAEDVARKYLDAWQFTPSSSTVYLCGNPHMIGNMEGVLERAGFPKASVKKENYWPA